MKLFSPLWCDALVRAWNARQDLHASMAGAGIVGFVVSDGGEQASLHWSRKGRMLAPAFPVPDDVPTFTATRRGWRRFIDGKTEAVDAILDQTIQYDGDLMFAVNFGNQFDAISVVAKEMEETRNGEQNYQDQKENVVQGGNPARI